MGTNNSNIASKAIISLSGFYADCIKSITFLFPK